jgi:tetratricopeptide (TPR) repeat protein
MSSAKSQQRQQEQFDSEGFDLGATVDAEGSPDGDQGRGGGGVVYEIGGGATATCAAPSPKKAKECGGDGGGPAAPAPRHPTDESERLKGLGNVEFRNGNHLDACDYYTDAIEKCPCGVGYGPSGRELLDMRDAFEEANREKAMERQRRGAEKRRSARGKGGGGNVDDDDDDDRGKMEEDDGGGKDDGDGDGKAVVEDETFDPPRHLYGTKLAVYHANRAACLLHLGRYGECVDDTTIAIMYDPTYAKAYGRRCAAYEHMDKTDMALLDARMAYRLEPNNVVSRKNVDRLAKIEEERMEKLKEETMGKLKDLGNSLLSNFGLSLNNFNAVQDPNTGGYSISFNQNADK